MALDDTIGRFESLLEELGAAAEGAGVSSTEVLLRVLPPTEAETLRLCAIPHDFDAALVAVLVPGLTAEEAEQRCRRLAELSVLADERGRLALHGSVRRELFAAWLLPEAREAFVAVSRRLADHFGRAAAASPDAAAELLARRRVFHLVGADTAPGFAEWEVLVRRARHQGRLSACTHLIALIREYDAVLPPAMGQLVAYHEAKLASDLRNFDAAKAAFTSLLERASIPVELRAKALLRLGFIACQRREFATGAEHYRAALAIIEREPSCDLKTYHVLNSLAEAYRELDRMPEAEALVQQGIEGARQARDPSALASLYNDLGTLHLRRREVDEAVAALRQSLDLTEGLGDRFRAAQVYNNLGMAYAETADWPQAEKLFGQSLRLKREAGDSLGLATTLINHVRVLRQRQDLVRAMADTRQAIDLFAEIHEPHRRALAIRMLARLHLDAGDPGAADSAFAEAIALFEESRALAESEATRSERAAVGQRPAGIPWWAWATLVGFIALCLLFGVLVALA